MEELGVDAYPSSLLFTDLQEAPQNILTGQKEVAGFLRNPGQTIDGEKPRKVWFSLEASGISSMCKLCIS